MADNFSSHGEVDLRGCAIEGDYNCEGWGPEYAYDCDRLSKFRLTGRLRKGDPTAVALDTAPMDGTWDPLIPSGPRVHDFALCANGGAGGNLTVGSENGPPARLHGLTGFLIDDPSTDFGLKIHSGCEVILSENCRTVFLMGGAGDKPVQVLGNGRFVGNFSVADDGYGQGFFVGTATSHVFAGKSAVGLTKTELMATDPGHAGRFNSRFTRRVVTIDHADLTNAVNGTAQAISIGSALPAGAVVQGFEVSIATLFSGGGATSVKLDVGGTVATGGVVTSIVNQLDVFTGAATGRLWPVTGSRPLGRYPSQQLVATFTPDGAHTLLGLTAGALTVAVWFMDPSEDSAEIVDRSLLTYLRASQ